MADLAVIHKQKRKVATIKNNESMLEVGIAVPIYVERKSMGIQLDSNLASVIVSVGIEVPTLGVETCSCFPGNYLSYIVCFLSDVMMTV